MIKQDAKIMISLGTVLNSKEEISLWIDVEKKEGFIIMVIPTKSSTAKMINGKS